MKIKIFLLALLSLIIAQPVLALEDGECAWTKQIDYPANTNTNDIKGCGGGVNIESTDSACTKNKPDNDVTNPGAVHSDITYICCCNPTQAVAIEEPKFIIPDFTFQVPIPGMTALTDVKCENDTCKIPWISEYVFGVYSYALSIVGIIAVLILMAAGLLWIVSGGDSGKIQQAKKMIYGSITGIMLLVSTTLLLNYINPDLLKQNGVKVDLIKRSELDYLAASKKSSTANDFSKQSCPTATELEKGIDFYATGYYKPDYVKDDKEFLCVVAMQCSCPKGRDLENNCDFLYKKTFPNYRPCLPFDADVPYCNMTASGVAPQIGDIAGPSNCESVLPQGNEVCFKGKTYKITDKGGGIKGKRIDIWSGNDLNQAHANTGVGKLTIGPCK